MHVWLHIFLSMSYGISSKYQCSIIWLEGLLLGWGPSTPVSAPTIVADLRFMGIIDYLLGGDNLIISVTFLHRSSFVWRLLSTQISWLCFWNRLEASFYYRQSHVYQQKNSVEPLYEIAYSRILLSLFAMILRRQNFYGTCSTLFDYDRLCCMSNYCVTFWWKQNRGSRQNWYVCCYRGK